MPRWLANLYLRLVGWKLHGSPPDLKKYVIVGAPHTSNWDAVFMLAMASMYRIQINWVGKKSLFKWPFGALMRWTGGVPVDRHSRQNAVQQLAAEFARRDELRLAIAPEGKRGRAEYWKSGFYFIACEAQVPIVFGLLDYKNKVGGLYNLIHPTGDIHADMEKIRGFYTGAQGKYPAEFGPVRLREEVDPSTAVGK
ncbi:MAG: lysophospholipid acyltransferase family protein [Pirellulaceae bacterium]|nr:lysophospholipid acyltransferase family protein [Pirellulaceae bacterium]